MAHLEIQVIVLVGEISKLPRRLDVLICTGCDGFPGNVFLHRLLISFEVIMSR